MQRILRFALLLVALPATTALASDGPTAVNAQVLEPSTLVLIGTGLIGIALVRSRYRSEGE